MYIKSYHLVILHFGWLTNSHKFNYIHQAEGSTVIGPAKLAAAKIRVFYSHMRASRHPSLCHQKSQKLQGSHLLQS